MATEKKHENLFFALRVLIATVVLGGVLAGLYFIAFRAYPTVAEWEQTGSHDAIVYDGVVYRHVGERGKGGYKESDYAIDKTVGKVADDGTVTETEPITLPADAEPGETVKRPAPDGDPALPSDHTYLLYSVKNRENVLLLLATDGSYLLYLREAGTWSTTDNNAFVCDGKTYLHIGPIGERGLSSRDYAKDQQLGLVHNELVGTDLSAADEDTLKRAEHDYIIHTVKVKSYLLIVEGADGKDHLYCREGYADPPETETLPETKPDTESTPVPDGE